MPTKERFLIIVILLPALFLQGRLFAASKDAEEHFRRGHKFYLDAKPAEAEAEFKKALKLNPRVADAYYYLGSIYFKQERYNEAVKECKEALRIDPKDSKSLIILGLSLQGLGFNDEAINAFLQACAINTQSAGAHSALGLAYCVKGDFEKAKEQYDILQKLDPELAKDLLERISERGSNLPRK